MIGLGEIVAAARFLDERIPRSFWKSLTQPVLTAAAVLMMGFSLVALRESSVSAAFNEIFVKKHTPAQMQTELRRVAKLDDLIKGIMNHVLSQTVTAARIRLAIIHNGEYGLAGATLMRYDVTHSVAREGFTAGPITSNSPLSNWSYLNEMLKGQCVNNGPSEWSPTERTIMFEMGADYRLICPVVDPDGRLQGALYMTWQNGNTHPPPDDIASLSSVMRTAGAQIAIAIEAGSTR